MLSDVISQGTVFDALIDSKVPGRTYRHLASGIYLLGDAPRKAPTGQLYSHLLREALGAELSGALHKDAHDDWLDRNRGFIVAGILALEADHDRALHRGSDGAPSGAATS